MRYTPLEAYGKLRILHLEDNVLDRELVCHLLAKGGADCEVTYAKSESEFDVALKAGGHDAILADFTLENYDGMTALATAVSVQPQTPFLFVTGTMDEERAIGSLKNGATDYVLKNNLRRLLPALRRALQEARERAQRHEAEEALRSAKEAAEVVAERLKHMAEALQASESFLQSLIENLPLVIYRKDTAGRLTFANKHYCERRGKPQSELLGKTDFDLSPPNLAQEYWADNLAVMETRQPIEKVEMQLDPTTGEPRWIHIVKVAVIDREGRVVGTQGIYWDVTERKHAEEALRQSEQRFREMAESIRDVFWVTMPDARRVLYVSPAYETIWGRPVDSLYASPTSWLDAIVPDDRPRVRAALEQLAQGTDYRIEYRVSQPNGALRWIEDRGFAVRNAQGRVERTLGVAADITERKELEEQLRQAQKMEAIGQLAGGIAHDFNNMLVVITGYASLLLDHATKPEDAHESLRQIYLAGERAANLTRQLLVFSRKHRLHVETLDLNNVVKDVGKMLRRLIGEDIGLDFSWGRGVPRICADAGMIEQVLMNLAVNARDAMPRGGHLTIKTEVCVLTETEAKHSAGARAGRFVCLSMRDTGSGIAPEILPRIFEPFFTTKEPGKGTGLGLATVFGIAQQHGGWITVESSVGVGTTFRIFLPEAPPGAAATVIADAADMKVEGGQETILLVEDEAPVREFAAAVLSRYGYRVLQAASGVDALETWKWHSERIALLVTDLVMPENMTGYELAQKLQAEKPSLKVICTSGYSGDMMEQVFPAEKGMQFIHKPYQPRQLAKAVRDILGTPLP